MLHNYFFNSGANKEPEWKVVETHQSVHSQSRTPAPQPALFSCWSPGLRGRNHSSRWEWWHHLDPSELSVGTDTFKEYINIHGTVYHKNNISLGMLFLHWRAACQEKHNDILALPLPIILNCSCLRLWLSELCGGDGVISASFSSSPSSSARWVWV